MTEHFPVSQWPHDGDFCVSRYGAKGRVIFTAVGEEDSVARVRWAAGGESEVPLHSLRKLNKWDRDPLPSTVDRSRCLQNPGTCHDDSAWTSVPGDVVEGGRTYPNGCSCGCRWAD